MSRQRSGRARIAPDPLSGQGIIWAIDDATSAMELLTRMHWRDLAQEMRARTLRDVEAYPPCPVDDHIMIPAMEKLH
jgi:hypothetical protein